MGQIICDPCDRAWHNSRDHDRVFATHIKAAAQRLRPIQNQRTATERHVGVAGLAWRVRNIERRGPGTQAGEDWKITFGIPIYSDRLDHASSSGCGSDSGRRCAGGS